MRNKVFFLSEEYKEAYIAWYKKTKGVNDEKRAIRSMDNMHMMRAYSRFLPYALFIATLLYIFKG